MGTGVGEARSMGALGAEVTGGCEPPGMVVGITLPSSVRAKSALDH